MKGVTTYDFYGLKLSLFSESDLPECIAGVIRSGETRICYGYSLGAIKYMRTTPGIYKLGNSSDLMLTDGRLFYLACRLMKAPVRSDLSIPGFVHFILKEADRSGYSLMLLGAASDTNTAALENIRKKYPGIRVLGGFDGYYDAGREPAIVEEINSLKPDILLIGMSSPKKEEFAISHREHLDVHWIVPCGGMIDVLAGKTTLTPALIKKLGLATVYRMVQEPKRLFFKYFSMYFYILFYFLPVLFWNGRIIKNRKFSIPVFCGLKNNN